MQRARTKPMVVVAVLCIVATARAAPRKAPKAPPPPTADQQEVIASVVGQTFPRPTREAPSITLCLDVQIEAAVDEDAVPLPPAPRHGKHKRARGPDPEATLPPVPVVRGAPPELVSRLARPWRAVASALSCRLDPLKPITLGDANHTAAQLVTVHLAPDVAVGTIKIEWTDSHNPTATNSRDCAASRGPRGLAVHCGGTWFQ